MDVCTVPSSSSQSSTYLSFCCQADGYAVVVALASFTLFFLYCFVDCTLAMMRQDARLACHQSTTREKKAK